MKKNMHKIGKKTLWVTTTANNIVLRLPTLTFALSCNNMYGLWIARLNASCGIYEVRSHVAVRRACCQPWVVTTLNHYFLHDPIGMDEGTTIMGEEQLSQTCLVTRHVLSLDASASEYSWSKEDCRLDMAGKSWRSNENVSIGPLRRLQF